MTDSNDLLRFLDRGERPGDDDLVRQMAYDHDAAVARAFFIADYLKLPKGSTLPDYELILQSLQKLPKTGSIKGLDASAVQCVGRLLPELSASTPHILSLLADYKAALSRVKG
jgi:hypothetical protein